MSYINNGDKVSTLSTAASFPLNIILIMLFHSARRIPPQRQRRSNGNRFFASRRRGQAVTELAVGLPVMLLVLMGTMEVCTMIRLKQKLKTAAYEGARVGILPDAKQDNVRWQCETLCNQHRLNDTTVDLTPANLSSLDSGDWFTVQVSAPFASNSLTGAWTLQSVQLQESVSIQKP